jgi:hypothetical protein
MAFRILAEMIVGETKRDSFYMNPRVESYVLRNPTGKEPRGTFKLEVSTELLVTCGLHHRQACLFEPTPKTPP